MTAYSAMKNWPNWTAHLSGSLLRSISVGFTHREVDVEPTTGMAGPAPRFFFAAERLRKRSRDWGRDGLGQRIDAQWKAFAPWIGERLAVRFHRGAHAVEDAYREVLQGAVPPGIGHVGSLWPA